jgi:hypothetical protein
MTSSDLFVIHLVGSLSTRESGARAREQFHSALLQQLVVAADFGDREVSPSFADELFGKLAEEIGSVEFRKRVRAIGLTESTRQLVNQVVARRLRNMARRTEHPTAA